MVNGIEVFTQRFSAFSEQFTVIGGTACSILFEEEELEFRSTHDVDIVLIVEALSETFAKEFWNFVSEGGYKLQERSTGIPQFYRFSKPSIKTFPKMIELFSRIPDNMTLFANSRLSPVHISEEISSLSAILLDDDYYHFLMQGRDLVKNLPVLKATYLVPFKMKAWLDLTERKLEGQLIDSKDIRKHRNDVFRILPLISPAERVAVSKTIKSDIETFLNKMSNEIINLKSLGIHSRTTESVIEMYTTMYVCK